MLSRFLAANWRSPQIWIGLPGAITLLKPLLCAALLLVLGALTFHQCRMYADAETLWRATLDRNPPPSWLETTWALFYSRKETPRKPSRNSKERCKSRRAMRKSWFNLGTISLTQGHLEEAIAQLRKAVKFRSNYPQARVTLGKALFKAGAREEALAQFHQAVQSSPRDADARYNLGVLLISMQQTDAAIVQFREAVKINPDFAEARNNLGIALFTIGARQEAIAQFRKAIEIKPDYIEARNNLAKALSQTHSLTH